MFGKVQVRPPYRTFVFCVQKEMTMKRTLLASLAVMAFATPAFAQSSTTVTTTAKQYFAQHHRPPCEDETEDKHAGERRSARPVAQYVAHRGPCEDETEDEHDGKRRR